jgi:hypothetical protein
MSFQHNNRARCCFTRLDVIAAPACSLLAAPHSQVFDVRNPKRAYRPTR